MAFQLARHDPVSINQFGIWDYVTHQLVASPPKPPAFNDWIDLVGYSRIPRIKTIGTYHVAKLKRALRHRLM